MLRKWIETEAIVKNRVPTLALVCCQLKSPKSSSHNQQTRFDLNRPRLVMQKRVDGISNAFFSFQVSFFSLLFSRWATPSISSCLRHHTVFTFPLMGDVRLAGEISAIYFFHAQCLNQNSIWSISLICLASIGFEKISCWLHFMQLIWATIILGFHNGCLACRIRSQDFFSFCIKMIGRLMSNQIGMEERKWLKTRKSAIYLP